MDAVSSNVVGNTILSQIGGSKALYMLGTPRGCAVVSERGVRIQIKGCRKANFLTITLEADLYTVTLSKFKKGRYNFDTGVLTKCKETQVSIDLRIDAENLCELIENRTQLRLSMGF